MLAASGAFAWAPRPRSCEGSALETMLDVVPSGPNAFEAAWGRLVVLSGAALFNLRLVARARASHVLGGVPPASSRTNCTGKDEQSCAVLVSHPEVLPRWWPPQSAKVKVRRRAELAKALSGITDHAGLGRHRKCAAVAIRNPYAIVHLRPEIPSFSAAHRRINTCCVAPRI